MAWPLWSKTRVITKRDDSRIEAAEMWFLRAAKRCWHLDRLCNEDIQNKLRIIGIHKIRNEYKQNWAQHFQLVQNHRFLKQAFKYHPRGKRDPGRPWSKWKLQSARTGPNPWSQKKNIKKLNTWMFHNSRGATSKPYEEHQSAPVLWATASGSENIWQCHFIQKFKIIQLSNSMISFIQPLTIGF